MSDTETASGAQVPCISLLADFAGYVLTCRRVNQRDWMEGLAEELSKVSLALGNTETYRYDGRDFIVKANATNQRLVR